MDVKGREEEQNSSAAFLHLIVFLLQGSTTAFLSFMLLVVHIMYFNHFLTLLATLSESNRK